MPDRFDWILCGCTGDIAGWQESHVYANILSNNKEQNCSVDESNIGLRTNTSKTHLCISCYCLEGHLFEYSFIKLPSKGSQIK